MLIFSKSLSEVKGPLAIITILSFGISINSSSIISIFSVFFKILVTSSEKPSLSTASACPAGTLFLSATSINNEPKILNSSFISPEAFSKLSLPKELLQTNSEK